MVGSDVFPIESSSLFRGHSLVFGGVIQWKMTSTTSHPNITKKVDLWPENGNFPTSQTYLQQRRKQIKLCDRFLNETYPAHSQLEQLTKNLELHSIMLIHYEGLL